MVNQDAPLSKFILDIFEKSEESFYFPLRSQKDARAFVKALHIKGVPYERIYEEIDEFEHNFTSWKKGLGRSGIGSRVIEMINRPLVQLLEEDDEALELNGISRNNNKAKEEAVKNTTSQRSWEDHQRVPPTPHSNGSNNGSNGTAQQRNGAKGSSVIEPSKAEPRSPRLTEAANKQTEEPKRMFQLRRTPPREDKARRPLSELELMKQQILSRKSESDSTDGKPTESEPELSSTQDKTSNLLASLNLSESESSSEESEDTDSEPENETVEPVKEEVAKEEVEVPTKEVPTKEMPTKEVPAKEVPEPESPASQAPPEKPQRIFADTTTSVEEKSEKSESKKEEAKKKKVPTATLR